MAVRRHHLVKLAEDNAHLDDVESSVPSRQVLQDSYELLVRARDQGSIVGARATVKSPDITEPPSLSLTSQYVPFLAAAGALSS
jgi:hypothetical protein